MGTCCTFESGPCIRIHLISGSQISAGDKDGESDAYIEFQYGDFRMNRFTSKTSKSIKTSKKRCQWGQKIEFPMGSLKSTACLRMYLKDKDTGKKDDHLGEAMIYYGFHPNNRENDVDSDRVNHDGEKNVRYFLPIEYNVTKSYKIEFLDTDNSFAGNITLKIELDDKKGDIIDPEQESLLDNQQTNNN